MIRPEKKNPCELSAIDWVRRVNRTWLVRGDINHHAEMWLEHLASRGDGRLDRSCENARWMCGFRDRVTDPKPWFYSGLFSLATTPEAAAFLGTHRITKAVVPSMRDDEEVRLWMDRVGPETKDLVARLRDGIGRLSIPPAEK